MLEFGNVARVLLLWVTALKHRAATSPPPSDPAGEDRTCYDHHVLAVLLTATIDAKNEGSSSSVATDVVHDPWWLSPVTSFLQNFTMVRFFCYSRLSLEWKSISWLMSATT